MKRDTYKKLVKWKNSKHRKPLILNGARQVGKTWLLKEFGRLEYESMAYISCDVVKGLDEVYKDFNVERIILNLSAITGVDIKPQHTLIVIDEIQEYPEAITALKYFCENAPEYHIAVAGSLLGIFFHKGFSFPVGKVNFLRVYPMTFEEFLDARGNYQLLKVLESLDYATIKPINEMLTEELRRYYFSGGMPEVVSAFVGGAGPNEVRALQNQILLSYANDISKHIDKREANRINMVWQNIPSQLAKDNKRFVYGAIKGGARAADFELAIEWLINAGLVYRINRVNQPTMPLKFYEDFSAFKLFVLDCGLLGAMVDADPAQILIGNNVFKEYKGMFTELYVLQQLQAIEVPIYYYSGSDSTVEIDFIVQCGSAIYPIEVKAETNLRSKSLRTYVSKYPNLKGLRTSMSPYIDEGWMENIPLYALGVEMRKRLNKM